MKMPGFSAESALRRSAEHFQSVFHSGHSASVVPQGLACALACAACSVAIGFEITSVVVTGGAAAAAAPAVAELIIGPTCGYCIDCIERGDLAA